jgi:hypothetical protein
MSSARQSRAALDAISGLAYHWGMRPLRSLILLGIVLGGGSAAASLVVALDLPTMVERADHVALVDVMSVRSAWDERHERILTTVDLSVVETWKGTSAPASHVSIVQKGGTVGDTTMTVFGMSRFTPGERALVFLSGPIDHARVLGMAQGKRVVKKDIATGRWMVNVPDRSGAAFVRPNPAVRSPVFETRARPIEDLRAEIKALAATPGKGR